MAFRNYGPKTAYKEYTEFGNSKYRICWDPQPCTVIDEKKSTVDTSTGEYITTVFKEDPNNITWMQETYNYKPEGSEIKDMILSYFNSQVDKSILNDCKWTSPSTGEIIPIYLSSENQFNYKAAYDIAFQTSGASLPFVLKFGDTDNPHYYTFESLDEFTNFYTYCINFINTTLQNGWTKKDSVDWTKYGIEPDAVEMEAE